MPELSKKADVIFRRLGDRGVLLLLFLAGVAAHSVFAAHMKPLSVYPDEFGTAAWTALFTGGEGGGGVISQIDRYYGWLGSVIYAPVMFIIKSPSAQYKAMLIINGAVVSLIPVIAYKISKRFGVKKAWMRVLTAAVCGMYPAVFAHSKFIWNETFCIIFPWLTAFVILTACDAKKRVFKHLLSVLAALTICASVCAHPRLLSSAAAGVAAILFARFFLKKKIVFLSSFIPAAVVFSAGSFLLTRRLVSLMWGDGAALRNTLSDLAPIFKTLLSGGAEPWVRLLRTLAGHLYYFAASTWGLGILGVVFFFSAVTTYLPAAGTGKPTALPNANERFLIFSAFAFVSALLDGAVSVLFKFDADRQSQYQDTVIFGRYVDGAIPLILLTVMCYVFLYGPDLRKLLGGVVALGGVYAAFFLMSARTIVNAENVNVSSILGMHPLRIGEKIDALITMDGLFLTVSAVFSLMALFIVFVCCSKRYCVHIISLSITVIAVYSCAYTAFAYLPFALRETQAANAPVYEVSQYVYNSEDAPPLFALDVPGRT
ncbi:MAG: hypothetical protein LBI36_02795, partial [Oscillospiraceae bacterium]|nr:hypothetical protein [Oscillospiraceae bacterium]